ncbi:MAG: flagellar hook protein FlgE [Desulfovibrionaceae bacterium]
MGLSSAMYTGISGLSAHGNKLSVISNNIANVSTMGFKSSTMNFEDLVSNHITTSAGLAQMGCGASISSLYSNFAQGSFAESDDNTDMAIEGDGFFVVRKPNSEQAYYTRAGNFRLGDDGNLIDTNGYIVQGWAVDNSVDNGAASASEVRIIGSITDIKIDNYQCPPRATSLLTLITQLNSDETSRATDPSNPYFSMASLWDGTEETPLSSESSAYSQTLTAYDANGSSHKVTVYFDKVDTSNTGGREVWEYIVTCDPTEDGRTINGVNIGDTSAAGMLMMGTLSFDAIGNISSMSSYTLGDSATLTSNNTKDLSQWTLADFSQDGYVMCTANFLEESNASTTNAADATNIRIDFGLTNGTPTGGANNSGWSSEIYSNAGLVGTDITNISRLPSFADIDIDASPTSSYSTSSSTKTWSQDGYSAGYLSTISVDRDGVLTGTYSNGEEIDLYVIALATFNSDWALERAGGNLYSETKSSGAAITNTPGSGSSGTISGNYLETSNVDLSEEFVDLISTEKGFQANSKVITTADTLLSTVISMVR